MPNILVLCTGNSCRSQMAEAYLRVFLPSNITVYSAGVEVHGLNARAVSTMAEEGIDISGHTSNHIDEYKELEFDYVITVCDNARESCPYFPSNARLFHTDFPDPAKATGTEEEMRNAFNSTRNLIKEYCRNFANKYFQQVGRRAPFFLATVFYDPAENYQGNTAAVVELETPLGDEEMQAMAADFMQPATSFVWPGAAENEFNIRWFAPDTEIGLCGHGSLAAIAHLSETEGKEISLHYRDGIIKGYRSSTESCTMVLDAIFSKKEEHIPTVIAEGLGVKIVEFYSNGNKEIVVLESAEEVLAMKPDFAKLRECDIFGYIVTAADDDADFVSRTIIPHVKQLEDPATGSSHAALVPFWAARLDKTMMVADQLSQRGGRFECRLEGTKVHLQGKAVIWGSGMVDLGL